MSRPVAHRGGARATIALAVAGLVGLVGCGIDVDSAPRDVEVAQRRVLTPSSGGSGAVATGTGRIYVLAPDTAGSTARLVSVPRDVPEDPAQLLQALIAGPNDAERSQQLGTAIPEGTALLSTRLAAGGVLVVDITTTESGERMTDLRSVRAIAAVAQIVFTASEVPTVSSVQLLVDGERRSWPRGDGELHNDPLSVYDYPGLIDSAQPDFPPTPAG